MGLRIMISHVLRRSGLLVSALLFVLSAAAQSDLPSAPSSIAVPKKQPAPAPPTTAPSAAPAAVPVAAAPAQSAPPQAQPQTTQPSSAGTIPAQAADQAEDSDPAAIIRSTVNEVNLVFTATDKHGRFIKDLKKEDIQIQDDAKLVTHISSFFSQTDLPLQVALLVDASNSVRDRFKFEQEAAIEFLNQIVRPNYDKAFVVGFDATPEVTQDFTDNSEFLAKGVRSLRPGGGTAMFDAIYFACRDKLMKEPRTGPVRRAVIILSDGDDNLSHVSREETIEMAQRAEVIIYTISTNISGAKNKGDKVMERMSEATGGRAFFPFKIQDVADAFTEIQDELRSQYALSYRPPDLIADGRFRPIEITATTDKNLRIRSRHGYYAPAPRKH
jgi:Ca-activated chloride channel homolog